MKIKLEDKQNIDGTEVIIRCKVVDDEVRNLLSALSFFQDKIKAKKNGQIVLVNPPDVYYFDSVNNQTFLYTKNDVYELGYKLYEIEEMCSTFLRISKNYVLNVAKIAKFKTTFNGRIDAELDNGETVIISRSYVNALKSKLGDIK